MGSCFSTPSSPKKSSEEQTEKPTKYLSRTETFRYQMGIPVNRGIRLWPVSNFMREQVERG